MEKREHHNTKKGEEVANIMDSSDKVYQPNGSRPGHCIGDVENELVRSSNLLTSQKYLIGTRPQNYNEIASVLMGNAFRHVGTLEPRYHIPYSLHPSSFRNLLPPVSQQQHAFHSSDPAAASTRVHVISDSNIHGSFLHATDTAASVTRTADTGSTLLGRTILCPDTITRPPFSCINEKETASSAIRRSRQQARAQAQAQALATAQEKGKAEAQTQTQVQAQTRAQEEEKESLDKLHRACCASDVTVSVIQSILRQDPGAASRSLKVCSKTSAYNPTESKMTEITTTQPYSYPLHLAIKSRASEEVLSLLIDAAPSVLTVTDGKAHETPLAALLRFSPNCLPTIRKITKIAPYSVCITDRKMNTVIHTAVMHGCSLEVARCLVEQYPEGMLKKNFHGKTPHETALTLTNVCKDDVAHFLHQVLLKTKRRRHQNVCWK